MKKKRIIASIIIISLFVTATFIMFQKYEAKAANSMVWTGSVDSSWYRNTSEKEYTIRTAEELAGFANIVNSGESFEGKTIYLENDIVLNEGDSSKWADTPPKNVWTPIGYNGGLFKGTFDGRGHKISGMYISYTEEIGSNDDQQALFGCIAQTSVGVAAPSVRNVSVVNSYIDNTCAEKSAMLIGQIYVSDKVPSTEVRIENVYVQGEIACNFVDKDNKGAGRVGGICCMTNLNTKESSTTVFRNVVSDVDVTSVKTKFIGGILACQNTGTTYAGTKTVFENCVNLGNLISDWDGSTPSGICANAASHAKVEIINCVNAGNMKGQKPAGCISSIGADKDYDSSLTVKNYINTGSVEPVNTNYSKTAAGAIYGASLKKKVVATFEHCYSVPVKNMDSSKQYAKDVLTGENILITLASEGFDITGWMVKEGVGPIPKMSAVVSGFAQYESNRLAAVQNTKADNGLMTVRLAGGIDSLNYKQVGFKVTINGSAETGVDTNTVSTVIAYDEEGTTKKVDAYTGFLTPYVYFEELQNISTTGTVTITVVPYQIDKKGNKTVGEEYTVVYEEGVLKKATSPKGGLIVKDDNESGYNKPTIAD